MTTRRDLSVRVIAITALVAVLAARSNLDDFAVVLPALLVVSGVGVLTLLTRSRRSFWCGTIGAIVGAMCPKPNIYIQFGPNSDPGERTLIWARMIGERNLGYALLGGLLGIALGYGINWVPHRRQRNLPG